MVQLNNKNKELVKAGKVIMNGGIVVYPTDTVYGIGCDPYSKKAIERLLIIKERENNPLPVLFKTVNKIEEIDKEYENKRKAAIKIGEKYKIQFDKINIAKNILNIFHSKGKN